MVTTEVFIRGSWKLEWLYLDEGYCEEYNEDDPDDKPLYRADLSHLNPENGEWEMCYDGSYCTLAPLEEVTDEDLSEFSDDLFDELERTHPNGNGVRLDTDGNGASFSDRVMQEWTWRTEP